MYQRGDLRSGRTVTLLLERLRLQGVNVEAVARHAGLEAEQPRADEPLEGEVLTRLWRALHALHPDAAHGLRLARELEPGGFSVLEYVCRNSETLGDALERARRYARLVHDALCLELVIEGETARLRVKLPTQPADLIYANELAVAAPFVLAREMVGEHAGLREVRLRHRGPRDVSAYHALFGCPVVFDAADNELVFAAALLDAPVRGADRRLRTLLEDRALGLLAHSRPAPSWLGRVERVIEGQLDGGNPYSEHVAQLLGMSERTLRRRLKAEGVTYQQVLDGVRHRLSERLRESREHSVAEISSQLGFANAGAFYKAYRRWAGRSYAALPR